MSERIIYEIAVPEDQRSGMDGTPDAYRVVVDDDSEVACIVYGLYLGEWIANAKCRWLVMELMRLGAAAWNENRHMIWMPSDDRIALAKLAKSQEVSDGEYSNRGA